MKKIFLISFLFLVTSTCFSIPVKILPLGDSITHGAAYNEPNSSYRNELYEQLTSNGFNFLFVGSDHTDDYITNNNQTITLAHEGHPGWRADQIDANLNTWLANYNADIVLLHVGSNDIIQGYSDSSTLAETEAIIDKLQAENPHIIILLAKVIPIYDPDISTGFNNFLTTTWAQGQSTNTSPVMIIDHHTGFTAADLFTDLVHPSQSGETKMAQKWYTALSTLQIMLDNKITPPSQDDSLPIQDDSLTLWLDAADIDANAETDTPNSNTNITNWSDKSGKYNHATQIIGTTPAIQIANGLNGKPVLDFTNSGYETPDADQVTGNSYTKFVVFKFDDTTKPNNLIASNHSYETTLWGSNSDQISANHRDSGLYINYITANPVGTTYHIAAVRYDPTDKGNTLKLDRNTQSSNTAEHPYDPAVTSVGSIGTNFYLDGKIAEAIIYDRGLSNNEITQVEDYLNNKWFTPSTLLPLITSPTTNTTLSGSTQVFNLDNNGINFTYWYLRIGTTLGANDIANRFTTGSASNITIANLPTDGSTVFVRLMYKENGVWKTADDYSYTAASGPLTLPTITAPVSGSTLTDSSETFLLDNNGLIISNWYLRIGSAIGSNDIANRFTAGSANSITVNNLPTDGSTVFVRLMYKENSVWKTADDYSYTASPTLTLPKITTPILGSTLSSSTENFVLNSNGITVTNWNLRVGSSVGSYNIANRFASGSANNIPVSNLPTDSSTIHVRLQYKENGIWKVAGDYTYSASSEITLPQITSPAAGSILSGSSEVFSLDTNGIPLTNWYLRVGSTTGANDIANRFASGSSSSIVINNLPMDSRSIYIRLMYKEGGIWKFAADYTYIASN